MMNSSAVPCVVRPSPIPLWRQVADLIRIEIAEGQRKPGDRLSTEAEFETLYRVSRITVRKALGTLLAENLVVRSHGKGTFVAQPTIRHHLSELAGIMDSIHTNGVRPKTSLHAFAIGQAPPLVAGLLGIGPEKILHFRRLYELNGSPLGLADVWIPGATGVTAAQANQASAYEILATHLGIVVGQAEIVIKAARADAGVRRLLSVPRSAALLCLERTSNCPAGRAREHTRFWVRSDHYEFSLSVSGPTPVAASLRASTLREAA